MVCGFLFVLQGQKINNHWPLIFSWVAIRCTFSTLLYLTSLQTHSLRIDARSEKSKGNFTGAWIPELLLENSRQSAPWHSYCSIWMIHSPWLKVFASSRQIPPSYSQQQAGVSRGEVEPRAAEVGKVHTTMTAGRLHKEFPPSELKSQSPIHTMLFKMSQCEVI